MKKNLKKAISAVIALALSLSLIPASFAAKLVLTDVADTASYATAVNTLVALDIINGYEDNTFKPDDLITRAEVTKVVVAALNKTDMAEGMTGSTGFADMDETSAWANGYINAGVQEGFINGMENNTFAPKANVTYAQIVKMLVASMGYEDYAQYMGGWPNGYLAIANDNGITDGVKKGANENVTRAEVAQLVYNALNTPIVKNTGMEYSNTGILVPTIAQMDGTGNNKYKSILTENFDAYVVEGKVTETAKSANSALENDQVMFSIEKTEKYEDVFNTTGAIGTPIYVGDTDAANFPGTYAQAIIMIDEYDDYIMKSFVPSGKNKSVVFDASLIDEDQVLSNNVFTGTDLYVFASESATKSTKYKLNTKTVNQQTVLDVALYVNGYAVTANATNIKKYVVDNAGEVELVDTYKTDGYYDAIYVDYYATAQVSSVTTANKIYFDSCTEPKASITLDVEENEDLVYNIYLGDEEIEVAALQEDDVLSIAWDVTGDIDASNEYVIYVSRDVQTGKLTSRNDEDQEVTVAGEVYSFVTAYPSVQQMPLADEYKLFLDAFGDIYKYETNTLAAKYAIIDKLVWSDSEEAYKATIVTTEGAAKIYVIDDSKAVGQGKPVVSVDALKSAVYSDFANKVKKDVQNRVIEYKVSTTSGEITAISFLNPVTNTEVQNQQTVDAKYEYNVNNNSIGVVKMSDATKIYDAIKYKDNSYDKYSDLSIASLDAFVDDTKYQAYAYGNKLSDGTYPIVVVTAGESAYNASTRFAVVAGAMNTSVDEETDEEIYTLPVLYKGDEVTLNISSEALVDNAAIANATFAKGDVIVFLTDSNNYVDQIDTVMKKATYDELVATVTTTNAANTVAANDLILINDVANGGNNKGYSADFSDKFTNNLASNGADDIKFILGPVVEKADKYFSIAKTDANAKTNLISEVIEVAINSDSTVYTYDFNKSDKTALEVSATAGIVKTNFISKYIVNDVIDWNLTDNTLAGTDKKPNDDQVNFALTLVVGGDAVDTLVYLAK